MGSDIMSTDHPSHDGETSARRVVISGRAYQYHPSQPLTIRSVFVTIRFVFAWLFACLLYFLMIIGLYGMGSPPRAVIRLPCRRRRAAFVVASHSPGDRVTIKALIV